MQYFGTCRRGNPATAALAAACVLAWANSLAGLPGGPASQQPLPDASRPPTESRGFVLRTQTNVVLVDVRVGDKSGRPVADLKPEEFRLSEDGVPQTITSFSFENVERLVAATADSGPSPTIDLAKHPSTVSPSKVLQDHRLMVLYFDLTAMPVDDLMRSLKAATDFVHSRMTPADLVAVVTYSYSLRVTQNFTNDRDALEKALVRIRPGESSSLSEAGTQGEAGTTTASGQEAVAQDVSAAFTPDETEFNIFNTDEKLAALESLARMLRDVPGRKSVLHFSSGVERTGIENQAQVRATIDAANQANVSLYTVDARGLVALAPGGDAASASPAGTAIYTGGAVSSQISSLHAGRETLAALSSDTGGRSFYDVNDFSQIFEQVQRENSSYYLLGYTPSNARSDGRFRRIRVEVTRPGVKVEARPGYFPPKEFRQFTREDKELQLQQALDLELPFVELPFVVEAAYFRQPGKQYQVVLAAKIPGSSVSFLKKSLTHQTEFDFVWRATDLAGRPMQALRDTLPVKLSGAAYERILSGNMLYEGGFVLPPGQYRLKVVVRENQSGRLGTFELPLVLPEIGETGLAVSSVVVSNQLKETDATRRGLRQARESHRPRKSRKESESPLEVGDRAILPSVTRVFRTDQHLYVYLESYGGKTTEQADASPSSGEPPGPSRLPSVALVFFRGGMKISEAGPFAGTLEKSRGQKASYFVQIPLEKFPPGRYWMQVNVLDPSADRVAFARIPLAIIRPPRAPAPAPVGM